MAQTLVSLYVHIVFSTKNRVDMIQTDVEEELWAYIGGILKNNKSKLLASNGTENHIHLLISLSKTHALSELVGDIKRDSSKWIKTFGEHYQNFQWQDGYGAFSVGYTQIADVKTYIANQKIHHAETTFEDELRYFLNKYEVEYDENYIWI
jgi:putative transposase